MGKGGRLVRRTLLGILILCAVAGVVFSLFHAKEHIPTGDEPVYLPDFSFPDAHGKMVTLADQHADLRIVNFWASWSPYSRDELPALVQLKQEFGDRVAVVALNRDTTSADGRAFLASLGLGDALTFAYDQEDTYFKRIGGYNMPETIFVGKDGEILYHEHGPMTYDAMRTEATRLLDGVE